MHQLKALLWRSYRVRSRQFYTTALDLFGPVIIISLYIATKILINQTHVPQVDESAAKIEYFLHDTSTTPSDHIDLRRDIKRHMCTKILYFPGSKDDRSSSIVYHLSNECGFQLTEVSSRRELVRGLQKSLASRVAYQAPQIDLNKINSTDDNCIRLPSAKNDEVIYQIGLARTGRNVVEIHMTDSAGSSVIFMPYSQGSTYNEYKLPQSDLNLGTHLIEICLANAFRRDALPLAPNVTSTILPSSIATSAPATTKLPTSTTKSPSPTRSSWVFAETPIRLTYGKDRQAQNVAKLAQDIKWRYKPYPVQTGAFVMPISTCIAILLAYLCTNTATVMRVTDDIEFGLHRYARLAGLPAGYYWLSILIMAIIQSFVQALVIAILLGVYTGEYNYDPICESAMTTRWMLLFTYSLVANTHAILLASLFDRSSNAVMACCMIASSYATYTLLLVLQWTPYRFNPMTAINWIALLNPASNLLALCCVLIAVAMQTNAPFGWSHLSERIIGGGFSELSVAELWALMFIQIILAMLLTIIIDQFRYSTTTNFFGFIFALLNELCFCNYCGPHSDKLTEDLRTKSSITTKSKKDPNRICCSMRHVGVFGATIMMPYTKSNPLKLPKEQLEALRAQAEEERTISKTAQLLVNTRSHSARDSIKGLSHKEQPLLLDDVIKQNLVWYKTDIKFKDLSLDFRFNQISFVLGQTDLKELLFAALLGLKPLDTGQVIIDGTNYSASTMSLARQEIGFLGDKDIFYNDLTIFENLQFFGSIRERSYKSYDSESLYVLSLLHLSSRRDNFPASLTFRSARKLALGVASVGYTKLLLLTEPTLNLRWRPRCQVHNLLKKYKSIRSIVVDSSDIDEAVAFGDRIVLLKHGSADLNDTPERLTKRLACGYWIVFEPITDDGRTMNSEAIRALERLTNEIFKQDKFDLNASKVSMYQDLMGTPVNSKDTAAATRSKVSGRLLAPNVATRGKTTIQNATHNATATSETASSEREQVDTRRLMVIVRVQHSNQSSQALCSLLKMFANRNIHGFRLAQISYESLEDILVMRMSRALYPDLPPDLLLSLQHRTQVTQKSPDQSPISVRRLSSSSHHTAAQHSQTSGTIFAAGLKTIIRDRLQNTTDLLVILMALIVSLIVVLLTLTSLTSTLRGSGGQQSANAWNVSTSSYQISKSASSNNSGSRQNPFMTHAVRDRRIVELTSIEQLYKNRLGFYVLAQGSHKNATAASTNNKTHDVASLLQAWHGNRNLAGVIYLGDSNNQTDARMVANLIDKSRDLAGSLIVFNSRTSEATIIFEPHLPHVFLASVKTLLDFSYSLMPADGVIHRKAMGVSGHRARPESALLNATLENQTWPSRARQVYEDHVSPVYTSRINFHHTWHEMIQGFPTRRVIYGVGFAFAEGIMMGALIVAPMRHRTGSKLTRIQTCYWLSMGAFDLVISLIQIVCYLILFTLVEGLTDGRLISALFIVLLLYKVASLPIPYLTSMAAESSLRGFLFILLLYFTVVWDMAIFLKAFIEWTLYSDSYLYTISSWVLFGLPITGLIESLVVINQINTINLRCPEIPAYTATTNTVDLEGIRRTTIVDTLLEKVHECLASGKTAVSTDVMHRRGLGILWSVYLTLLFGLIIWAFLLTSERLFGIVARRLSSVKTSNDPMKTVIRIPDHTSSLFVWDKERDRLISEYIRCMNEFKYVKSMARNCLILRIWLKPMSDQASPEHHLSAILEPLISLGHGKNDLQVELRTTLQIFVRIGDETRHCRVDKIQLIETYSKYVAAHGDVVAKFAVVDWTRENLYKILLHGHYNNKTSTAAIS